jgi:hypothetical protein
MAFQLRQNESVRSGLRRLARKALQSARQELGRSTPPGDAAVHDARTAIKKARAIANLIADDDGGGLDGGPKRLRKISRTLSRLRDTDAMLDTVKKLKRRDPAIMSDHAFARLKRKLAARKAASWTAAGDDQGWESLDRQLRNLRRDARKWRSAHRQSSALAGMRRTYRRGRNAMARAKARQRAEDFHEWRKELKAQWYQLRLLEACAPRIARDLRLVHQTEQCLGDEHNVAVLCEELSRDAALCDFDRLKAAASDVQRELRGRALDNAKRIYAETPRDYARRLTAAFKAWQRRPAKASSRTVRSAKASAERLNAAS